MLKAKARIKFTVADKNYRAHDKFYVAFRFGEQLIFSGRIRSDVHEYVSGTEYNVDVDFFTIDNEEAYAMVKHTLSNNARFVMCAGSRIIGDAVITAFVYECMPVLGACG